MGLFPYSQGTITLTNGSAVVTGTGTAWLTNAAGGNAVVDLVNQTWLEIQSVDADAQITLIAPYSNDTQTDVAYEIVRDFVGDVPVPNRGDLGVWALMRRVIISLVNKIAGKADVDHAHNEYAASNHAHNEYAANDHAHNEYAASDHAHNEYAANDHAHNEYAASDHAHNEYAPAADFDQALRTSDSVRFDELGVGTAPNGAKLTVQDSNGMTIARLRATYSGQQSAIALFEASRVASNQFTFFLCRSDADVSGDIEYKVDGQGDVAADGSFYSGGADICECFEWLDSNPNDEDRRGWSVVFDGDKIRRAEVGEIPVGIITGNPSLVGNAAWNKWTGKYLRDDFGSYMREDYEVLIWEEEILLENEDGEETKRVKVGFPADAVPEGITVPPDALTEIRQRRILNPEFDPDRPYEARPDRIDWGFVGFWGRVRLVKGDQTADSWKKLRDISDSVEEWFIGL